MYTCRVLGCDCGKRRIGIENLGIQNTGAISINLAEVVLTNFHVQSAGRNTPDKLAYFSESGIMNILSLLNIKIQLRHLQNTYMLQNTRCAPWNVFKLF